MKAEEAFEKWWDESCHAPFDGTDDIHNWVQAAWRNGQEFGRAEAAREMRERCAKAVQGFETVYDSKVGSRLAAEIRALPLPDEAETEKPT